MLPDRAGVVCVICLYWNELRRKQDTEVAAGSAPAVVEAETNRSVHDRYPRCGAVGT